MPDEKEINALREQLEELESYRGRHTELITVYVPAGYNLNNIVDQLTAEVSTAQNIKSKTTRTNVIDGIERIIRYIKLNKELPKNGMALFCGNISKVEGQPDIRLWAIEPLQPLRVKYYRCDQVFMLEPLKDMLQAKDVWGLIVLDRKEATFGILEGKQIRALRNINSGVPGKIKAGGQSAARFERLTEGAVLEFFKRVSDSVKEIFFDMPRLKGLFVGGPGPTKEEWLRDGQLVTQLKDKIKAIKDIGYVDESGLEVLVEECKQELENEDIIGEKKILEKFFFGLAKNPDKTTHDLEKIKKALEHGAVDTLIISTSFDKKEARELENNALSIAANVVYVSTETNEGLQFKNISGIGAILRFSIG